MSADLSDTDPAASVAASRQHLERGDVDGAERILRRALDDAPDHPGLLQQLGALHARRGDLPAAVACLERAVGAAPNDPWMQLQLCKLLMRTHQVTAAERAARAALELAPGHALALGQLSDIRRQCNDLDGALAFAEDAWRADPRDPWQHVRLSRLHLARGDAEAAEASARYALTLASGTDRGGILGQISDVLEQRGDRPGALALAHQATEAHPDDPWLRMRLSRLCLQDGDIPGAEQAVRAALDLAPDHGGMLTQLSDVLDRAGDRPGALRAAQGAATATPNDPWAQWRISRLHLADGALDAAEQAAHAALRLSPDHPDLQKQLRHVLARREADRDVGRNPGQTTDRTFGDRDFGQARPLLVPITPP